MPKYFNDTYLKFATFPEKNMIYNLTLEETKIILDFIAIFLNDKKIKSGMSDLNIILRSPFHCFVLETEEYIIYGVSNDRCITNGGVIIDAKEVYLNENAEDLMKKASKEELGFSINNFIWVKKDIVYKYKDFLTSMTQVIDFNIAFDELKKTENAEFGMEIVRCTNEFFEKLNEEGKMLNINPVFKARNLTVDENMCFCVLPFDSERLEIFNDIIKPELEKEFGLTIIRADTIFSNNDIMEDIWTYICKSRFVIADVSLQNPNVFYELGICHTVGKDVITICDESSLAEDYSGKLPFDIQSRRTIFYKNSGSGPKKMVEDLKNTVKSILDGKIVLL